MSYTLNQMCMPTFFKLATANLKRFYWSLTVQWGDSLNKVDAGFLATICIFFIKKKKLGNPKYTSVAEHRFHYSAASYLGFPN